MTSLQTDEDQRVRARLIGVVTVILALAALKLGRPVTMPLTVGLFIAMLAWPLQHGLQRRLPRWFSLLIAMLAVIVVLAALIAAIGWSASTVIDEAGRHQNKIESLMTRAAAWARQFGVNLPWAESPGATAGGPESGSDTVTALAERASRSLFTGGAYIALALGFAALALAELDDARNKIRARFRPEHADRLLAIGARVSGAFRRYVKVKSLTSAIAGTASGLFALAVGLDFAAVWAFSAFLLEYVPTIGSILAVIPPSAWAFIQFDGIMKPLGILGGFTALQLFLGNYVDPRIEGRFMAISPLIVLLSITFWAWMWGPAGALLGVPLTVSVAVVARHFDRARWVWALITEPKREHAETAGADEPDELDDQGDDGSGDAVRVDDRTRTASASRRP